MGLSHDLGSVRWAGARKPTDWHQLLPARLALLPSSPTCSNGSS